MHIKQIQATADPVQDRLLVRIATDNGEEVRVFFTRRFLKELWPHLMAMLFGHLASPAAAAETSSGEFGLPFQNDNPTLPLGAAPLLPGEAKLEADGEGKCRLTVRELRERSFTLSLNTDLFQALCAMLRAGAEQAQWDLALDYGTAVPAGSAPTARKHLH